MAKYDFNGIKSQGANSLIILASSNPSTAWIAKIPGIKPFFEFIANYLANKGLVLMNLGAIVVNGELDQHALDSALDSGIKMVQMGHLTPEQEKEIDDEVIKAADRDLPYGK